MGRDPIASAVELLAIWPAALVALDEGLVDAVVAGLRVGEWDVALAKPLSRASVAFADFEDVADVAAAKLLPFPGYKEEEVWSGEDASDVAAAKLLSLLEYEEDEA